MYSPYRKPPLLRWVNKQKHCEILWVYSFYKYITESGIFGTWHKINCKLVFPLNYLLIPTIKRLRKDYRQKTIAQEYGLAKKNNLDENQQPDKLSLAGKASLLIQRRLLLLPIKMPAQNRDLSEEIELYFKWG